MSESRTHLISLLKNDALRPRVVGALRSAGCMVSEFATVAELETSAPDEPCDLLLLNAGADGFTALARIRGMAPQIPAVLLGENLDLEDYIRAIRLGVVEVLAPDGTAELVQCAERVRQLGAVAALNDAAHDRLAQALVAALRADELRNEADAKVLEQEHLKVQAEFARLAELEQKLRAHERHIHDLQAQLQHQADRRFGSGRGDEWQKLEREKARLDAAQRNLVTEKIMAREEIEYLRKRNDRLVLFETKLAEHQAWYVAREKDLADKAARLSQREEDLVRQAERLRAPGLPVRPAPAASGLNLLQVAKSAVALGRR